MPKDKMHNILWTYLMQCLQVHHAVEDREHKTIDNCIQAAKDEIQALLLTEEERKSIIEKTKWSNGKARFAKDVPQLDLAEELTKAQNEKMEKQK